MMRVGIVAAFDREARALIKRRNAAAQARGDVLFALSGMGAVRARAAGEHLLEQGATALLSWGVAAALDRGLTAGDLLLPKVILAADLREYSVSAGWQRALCERLAGGFVVNTGPLAETPMVLSTPAQKRALLLHSSAIAADMESAALAALACEARVPFVSIRAVSDTAGAKVPPWLGAAIDSAGRLSTTRMLKEIIGRPLEWIAMSHLALGFRAARVTLTGVAERVGAGWPAAV
jgi:adenosylhomocysteine nucleosidase